ncbi:SGNH/GDSL hydrolase family protein [Nemorincola caseinilytica]|uniref:SGNH/GDSL hydrolase family protein n=1 Tax=Nemorincola caseinilytica TaxID=2054315 RepID=A0ABP8N6M6_9BACT
MHTYLALGDSYTIGEQVSAPDNFPHQAVRMLREKGTQVTDPVIIATTGWTTDELATSIREHNITDTFSFVSLLIGVNNQYRGRSIDNYRDEFTQLLHQAIHFAGGRPQRVFVLSIPDWGVTPFAADRDRSAIATEIDAYNAACREIALANECHYIEITESTRQHGADPTYLVDDKLHPSGREYAIWAQRLVEQVHEQLSKK